MSRRAIFIDVGGPMYPDDNFLAAAFVAINALRETAAQAPITPQQMRETFDRVRNRSSGSLRKTLAAEFLGSEDLHHELHQAIAPLWVHPEGSLFSDVIPFLQSVASDAVVAIVANQEQATIDALVRDQVAPFIDVWGISAVVGFEKPSAKFFQWALDQAGVEAASAVHIGNRFTNDVLPAHQLGLKTVWLLRGEAPDDPPASQREMADIVTSSLDGLGPRVLAMWGGSDG